MSPRSLFSLLGSPKLIWLPPELTYLASTRADLSSACWSVLHNGQQQDMLHGTLFPSCSLRLHSTPETGRGNSPKTMGWQSTHFWGIHSRRFQPISWRGIFSCLLSNSTPKIDCHIEPILPILKKGKFVIIPLSFIHINLNVKHAIKLDFSFPIWIAYYCSQQINK